MGTISYTDAIYTLTIGGLRQNADKITTCPAEVVKGESNVAALLKFIELYESMGEMMKEYQELLHMEQESLAKVGAAIKLQDMAIAALWK